VPPHGGHRAKNQSADPLYLAPFRRKTHPKIAPLQKTPLLQQPAKALYVPPTAETADGGNGGRDRGGGQALLGMVPVLPIGPK